MEELAVFISFLATGLAAFYYYMNTRHKERMALIDSGADASLFYSSKKKPQGGMISFFLGLGIVSVSLSMGILLALFLERLLRAIDGYSGDYEEVYVIMVFLSIGTGLIISYFVIKKLIKKEEREEAEKAASN